MQRSFQRTVSPPNLDKNDLAYQPPINKGNNDDLINYLKEFEYSKFIYTYHIEIWVSIILLAITIYWLNKMKNKLRNKDFNKNIIDKNNERSKIAREKFQEQYKNTLKTATIPSPSSTEFENNHNYSKNFSSTSSTSFKATEGMSPSGTGGRVTFNSRDRSCTKYS